MTIFKTLVLGEGKGGDINIRGSDSVEMIGIGFDSYQQAINKVMTSETLDPFEPHIVLETATGNAGASGNITIDTGRLVIRDGVTAVTTTLLGGGNGGNITIGANVFDLAGSGIFSGTEKGSSGIGGNISFTGEKLIVRDGAILTSVTRSEQPSGNITIKAAESVEVLRSLSGTAIQTLIASSSLDANGKGKAGDITIDTKRLNVAEGAGITVGSGGIIGTTIVSSGGPAGDLTIRASESIKVAGISGVLANGDVITSFLASETSSPNQGGNLNIATSALTVRDGGGIYVSSGGAGNAGNLTIDASSIEVFGTALNSRFISQINASGGGIFGVPLPNATGNAGSINLNVDRLMVRDGATVGVRALGIGNAGTLTVIANSIALDTKGRIDGTTVSGTGANINLQARDIQLRHGSRITTDAGSSDGGNIRINSDILVALPKENSDITANARTAMGGQVTVNVPNVFGFTAVNREQARSSLGLTDAEFAALQVDPTSLLPTSDIAAISQQAGPALQGTVTFSSSGVNPEQGLVALPQNVVDPAVLIVANPCNQQARNEFTITGKGGVPPNPKNVLNNDSAQFSWVESSAVKSSTTETVPNLTERLPAGGTGNSREVIPAQGWVMNDRGQVTLVGYNPTAQVPQRSRRPLSVCTPR